jgi:hypothetical protein
MSRGECRKAEAYQSSFTFDSSTIQLDRYVCPVKVAELVLPEDKQRYLIEIYSEKMFFVEVRPADKNVHLRPDDTVADHRIFEISTEYDYRDK